VYSIFLPLSVSKALFGSLEGKGGEGFGGTSLEKIEKSFKKIERMVS